MSNDNKQPDPKGEPPKPDPEITLKLKLSVVQAIVNFLGNAPANQVLPLLASIQQQVNEQTGPKMNRSQRRAVASGRRK